MTLKPGQQVLVRAHHGTTRTSGTICSINRAGDVVVATGNGEWIKVWDRSAILPLVQR